MPGRGLPERLRPAAGQPDRKLVWSDEFDGDNGALPDPDKWELEQYADATDDEKQCYTDSAENVHTDGGGYLVISANKESGNCADGWYRDITSARLTTKGIESWEHARFEIRAKMPTGVGTWPAFWAMGEDDRGRVARRSARSTRWSTSAATGRT